MKWLLERYSNSLNNLKDIISICNEINIYDNTTRFREVINIENEYLIWKSNIVPQWIKDIKLDFKQEI